MKIAVLNAHQYDKVYFEQANVRTGSRVLLDFIEAPLSDTQI
jgi:hypothetical protein